MNTEFTLFNVHYDVKKMHTRQLINLLKRARKNNFCECCHRLEDIRAYYDAVDPVIPIIKSELAMREHIPNKHEAKEIRVLKHKTGKNKKDKRYVNK
jgi:hypothetical protein